MYILVMFVVPQQNLRANDWTIERKSVLPTDLRSIVPRKSDHSYESEMHDTRQSRIRKREVS